MQWIEAVESWFQRRRDHLNSHGRAELVRDPTGRTEGQVAGVCIELPDESVEIIVWQSGQAEFNRGPAEAPTFEHVGLSNPQDFELLMKRVEEYLGLDDQSLGPNHQALR